MNRNSWIAVTVSIVVVAFLLFGESIMGLFNQPQYADTASLQNIETIMDTNIQDQTAPNSVPEGLQITDTVVGTGAEATAGSLITVHYVGTLTNGQKFDSSVDRGQPFQFTLGEGRVIQGWEQGFAGMKVGGKRTLVIPPSLGYGPVQAGPIPPNSTLVFQVELLGVE